MIGGADVSQGYIIVDSHEWGLGPAVPVPDAGSYEREALEARLEGEHDDLAGAEVYEVVKVKADGFLVTNTDPIRVVWWPDEGVGAVLDNAGCYWAKRRAPIDVLAGWLRGESYDGAGVSR